MEKRKLELEALVSTQKEQLNRYEKRLKDVVTAYKGLLKEKEALEASLTAFTTGKEKNTNGNDLRSKNLESPCSEAMVEGGVAHVVVPNTNNNVDADINQNDKNHLQRQIITLVNSLATLSAEKSRMEASFQVDKKQLRAHMTQKEQQISELQAKIKENAKLAKADVDEIKAKWIIERQEREKETNNQMIMIRELQKLYADERHLKENIEMQLNNFKTQFASNEAENARLCDLQTRLNETKAQLKLLQQKTEGDAANEETMTSIALLQQVQQEMQQLKEQHAVAIKNEQRRALCAEEQSRKQVALHEGRVANLEARLAELSSTVGKYDRLRQQDQENIQSLKQQLHDLEANSNKITKPAMPIKATDVATLVDEIMRLKKLLVQENMRSVNPIDLNNVFLVSADHVQCQEELKSVQQQLEIANQELSALHNKVEVQKSHITTLQEKVIVLNRNIDEAELELKQQGEKLRSAIKEERVKYQEALNELENDSRFKISELEQQLQKQRERSLQLLDEKEQEIKTLQTSFEVFHNVSNAMSPITQINAVNVDNLNEANVGSSDAESVEAVESNRRHKYGIKAKKLSLSENCHMLHYVNELARKDIEIATLRKAKYAAETSLRKAIQEKVTAQQELNDKIEYLEEQVDRLERCKTREGANLEYLKNVIISFILTKDIEGKRHMLNAISAVLQFTNAEMQTIQSAFHKK